MQNKAKVALCLATSLILSTALTHADQGEDNDQSNDRSARSVQVHIDEKTGHKIGIDDSEITTATAAAAVASTSRSTSLMPTQNSDVRHHSDGTMSAQLGVENLQYLVVTIDEDGTRSLSHRSTEAIESGSIPAQTKTEEK